MPRVVIVSHAVSQSTMGRMAAHNCEKGLTPGELRHNVNLTIKRLFNRRITRRAGALVTMAGHLMSRGTALGGPGLGRSPRVGPTGRCANGWPEKTYT